MLNWLKNHPFAVEAHFERLKSLLFLMGLLCFTSSYDLIYTPLGKKISFGLAIFWGIRLVVQFFGYSSQTWKGKKFETVIHILFSMIWIYLTVIFTLVYFY